MQRDQHARRPGRPATFLLAVGLVALLASCSGKAAKAGPGGGAAGPSPADRPPAATQAQPGPPGNSPPQGGALKMQPVPVPAGDAGVPAEPAPAKAPAPGAPSSPKEGPAEPELSATALSARAFVLAAAAGPILPEDSLIGPLQDWRSQKKGEAGALKAAAAFLDGLLAGRVAEELVAPDRLPLVTMLARPFIEGRRAESCRIGSISSTEQDGGTSAFARILLAYPPAAADTAGTGTGQRLYLVGELALRQEDGVWYIEGISLVDPPPS